MTTTLELRVELPSRLAQQALDAGLLTPRAVSGLIRDAMRRRAAQELLEGAARAAKVSNRPMSLRAIQKEVDAVRRARRAK